MKVEETLSKIAQAPVGHVPLAPDRATGTHGRLLTPTFSLTHKHTRSRSLTLSLTLTLTPSLSHTHTRSLSHTRVKVEETLSKIASNIHTCKDLEATDSKDFVRFC